MDSTTLDDPYRRKPEVARHFSVTPRTIDNWVRAGRLPEPERLPNGRPAWRESVIRAAMNAA